MFQNFESTTGSDHVAERLKALRAWMTKAKIDAVLVPRADEHQGEYVPPSAERLKWLTGFTGSAGIAIAAKKSAALFIDGRYTVQAKAETDTSVFDVSLIPRPRISEWLSDNLTKGGVIGFDPWLHTISEAARLTAALDAKGIKLKPLPKNPIDVLWGKLRPAPPAAPVIPHPLELAGKSAAEKIADIQKRLKDDGQHAVLLTLPDSICWLFNIRGSDVAHNPVALAFAIVPSSGKAELFIAPEKIDAAARAHLSPVAKLSAPDQLPVRIKALRDAEKLVRLDPDTAAAWFERALGSKSISRGQDPCILPKAIKTPAEIQGTRDAHLRDGAAVVRFLAWLEGAVASGSVDEITAVKALENFRRETGLLKDISFATISGSGANGAIVHYRVTDATNRTLQNGELFLLDSGAQYQDGTTDITRTIAVGQPSEDMRRKFTAVLKGHIAIATARFPKGTRGLDLDPFARRALWDAGCDFDHGTGHGIGSYLSVHEGPQSISRAGTAVLQPGMLLSNEPGYYKEGEYGIRIENVVLVTPLAKIPGGDREMMAFETLTLAPMDRRSIDADALTSDEFEWINAYHARVYATLSPLLDGATASWLKRATEPLT
ncbi:MAG: aminopeptidase P family protein [Hyphomicrobium sp.]|nr:aminopeptidase P family protein [Hyphomicrobium sp.]